MEIDKEIQRKLAVRVEAFENTESLEVEEQKTESDMEKYAASLIARLEERLAVEDGYTRVSSEWTIDKGNSIKEKFIYFLKKIYRKLHRPFLCAYVNGIVTAQNYYNAKNVETICALRDVVKTQTDEINDVHEKYEKLNEQYMEMLKRIEIQQVMIEYTNGERGEE